MRSSRTWSRRLVAAVSSFALIGAGLITLAHHVQTRHEICAEHGELMHVGAGAGALAVSIADAISDDPLELDHDEHCAIAWSTVQTIEPPVSGCAAMVLASAAGAPPGHSDDSFASRALLHLAPKTSPPRA